MDNPIFDRGSPESVLEENKPPGQPGGPPEPNVGASGITSPELLLSRPEENNSGVQPDKTHISIDPEFGLITGVANESEIKIADK